MEKRKLESFQRLLFSHNFQRIRRDFRKLLVSQLQNPAHQIRRNLLSCKVPSFPYDIHIIIKKKIFKNYPFM